MHQHNEDICHKYWAKIIGNKNIYFNMISHLSNKFKELKKTSSHYIKNLDKVYNFMI